MSVNTTPTICAVIDTATNKVVNVIVGDINSPTMPDTYLVEIPNPPTTFYDIGYTWDGTFFHHPDGTIIYY